MQNTLLKPKIISVEALAENQAKVVMEPFERGYGHTLGNALRRVLFVVYGRLCSNRSQHCWRCS